MECGKAGEVAVPAKLSTEEERIVTGDSDSLMCGGNRSVDENSMSGRNGGEDLAVEETMETEFLQGIYVIQTFYLFILYIILSSVNLFRISLHKV